MDQNNEFPDEAVKKLGKLGWMGIPYPKEYGGAGLDALSYAIAVEELARVDGGNDIIILDTAGRLQIDEVLMQELVQIKEAVPVDETLLVVDAMAGQDAVNVAKTFNETVGIDGIILTKTDGDTRGGAALSVLLLPCILCLKVHFPLQKMSRPHIPV